MKYKLYVDLDGVLCHFEDGVLKICGKLPHEMQVKDMWRKLATTPDFYANLEWMPDGKILWNFCKLHDPTILTGIPMGNWAPKQKRVWCGRELGWDVPVITCFARDKYQHANPEAVLIDDRQKNGDQWEAAGGIFILHTSAEQTINELKKLGF